MYILSDVTGTCKVSLTVASCIVHETVFPCMATAIANGAWIAC